MPAVSKAQWAKLALLLKRGEITKAQFDRFTKGVSYKRLPERVKKKRRGK